jgi:hypothetical protein
MRRNDMGTSDNITPKRSFLCSCRQDRRYAQRLLIHLDSYQHPYKLDIWHEACCQLGLSGSRSWAKP